MPHESHDWTKIVPKNGAVFDEIKTTKTGLFLMK